MLSGPALKWPIGEFVEDMDFANTQQERVELPMVG